MDERKDERKILISTTRQLVSTDLLLGNRDLVPRDIHTPRTGEPATETGDFSRIKASEKPAMLDEIARETAACTKCELCKYRKNAVPGEGNPDADVAFVGEAPGADEDKCGRPFVGKAGQLLDKMILAMGLDRKNIFICNMLKCRPPGNRHPAPEELEACRDYLSRQLSIIRPRVIVTLGNPATKRLLNTGDGITKIRGTWQKMPDTVPGIKGTAVMPTFHPSYVLRRYTVETRRKVWSDLQAVMKNLGLEGSGKKV